MKLAVEQSTTKVFSLVGALAVLGTLLFATSAVAAPKEGPPGPTGATGATGPAGANGTNGTNGANGSNGAVGEKGATGAPGPSPACPQGVPVASCTLPSKGQETGVWSANLTGIPGDLQQEAQGVASFPLRLSETATITPKYRDSREVETPEEPCAGSVNEPVAIPGWFCVYRGEAGLEEKADKNVKFVKILKPKGEEVPPHGETAPLGALIVFRSDQFTEEGTTPAKLTAETYLSARGSWAVTEK